jgi:hypothetical protein
VVLGGWQGKFRVAADEMLQYLGPVARLDTSGGLQTLASSIHGRPVDEVTADIRDILASQN